MAADCDSERSSAWWNNNANYDMEHPPAPKYIPSIAKTLGISQREVAEMITEQWYGVCPDDKIPNHLRSLVAALRRIESEDLPVVENLVHHLSHKHSAKITLEMRLSQGLERKGEQVQQPSPATTATTPNNPRQPSDQPDRPQQPAPPAVRDEVRTAPDAHQIER
ncbi:hypothetical protein [Streptomyces sp. BRA346]|uniref:hypothetical protein n=1 Tax=Streptomyces sp. BRA346 TaxID=2878199 RepID=UPI004064C713